MAIAGIQTTVDLYIQEQADLTQQLDTIMSQITVASKKSMSLAQDTHSKKEAVYEKADDSQAYKNSDQYDEDLDQIQDDYEMKLAEINDWESQLETKKQNLETQVQAVTSYKESFQSALKSNVQSDFKYAQSS